MRRGGFQPELDHQDADDGPFVSFTDLLAGLLFIFLIMIAALLVVQRRDAQNQNGTVKDERIAALEKALDQQTSIVKGVSPNGRSGSPPVAEPGAITQQRSGTQAAEVAALKDTIDRQREALNQQEDQLRRIPDLERIIEQQKASIKDLTVQLVKNPTPPQSAPPPVPDENDGPINSYTAEGWPVINGHVVKLAGIEPLPVDRMKKFMDWITKGNEYLFCSVSHEDGFHCVIKEDVTLSLIRNGQAQTTPGASKAYLDAEIQARHEKRGIWH